MAQVDSSHSHFDTTSILRSDQAESDGRDDFEQKGLRPFTLRLPSGTKTQSFVIATAGGEGIMAATQHMMGYIIKIEDSPSPEAIVVPTEPVPVIDNTPISIDPRDPECFLKRCSGFNKKTKLRCSSVIGKKSEQSCHPTYLPTCRAHRDQQSFAGWCQYQHSSGERCSRLFRWTPPYFELCTEHQGHPDTPCYFLKLPLELRHEIFRYLIPDRPIGSSTAQLHNDEDYVPDPYTYGTPFHPGGPYRRQIPPPPPFPMHSAMPARIHLGMPAQCGSTNSVFPMPALDLFLVNRQFYYEIKDLLFSTVPFTIDVRKDGTFMCGRRLLEPRRADGSSHFMVDEADEAKQRFLKYFDWSAVKHYKVDILVENWANGAVYPSTSSWDEEVELYDIRDYISVVVSGVLAKAVNLCKLQIRLCLADFDWTAAQTLLNTALIVGPFESLRNVRQPQILGISAGKPVHNAMLTVRRPPHTLHSQTPICSVPPLPSHTALLAPGMPEFDAYAASWARSISASSAARVVQKAPIRSMFTAFKEFYTELAPLAPEVTFVQGRHAFLHRARVARENGDVEALRRLRNELIQYWYAYLEQEERKKEVMNRRLGRMLDEDVYPASGGGEKGKRSVGRQGGGDALVSSVAGKKHDGRMSEQTERFSGLVASPEHHIDDVDVECFAHVNLSADWYAEPGPSTKKRRVDSGFSETPSEMEEQAMEYENDGSVMYVGKGKGKMVEGMQGEVICID